MTDKPNTGFSSRPSRRENVTDQQLATLTEQLRSLPVFVATRDDAFKEKIMNRIMSGLLATALSASFAVAEIVPVNAQPTYVPLGQNVSSDVQTVDHRRWRRSFNRDRDFPAAIFVVVSRVTTAGIGAAIAVIAIIVAAIAVTATSGSRWLPLRPAR
ncbi:hypothetical protein [Mesorhizobium sp. M6A.T.Cr.TU.014.01.1.1]|uniref:hypothetical protein n=1 Tax=Mesorhizobium sp. M6A.T.Cr.TU.014.01.1.1 TaxID=2496676 RepID=UPI0032B000E5